MAATTAKRTPVKRAPAKRATVRRSTPAELAARPANVVTDPSIVALNLDAEPPRPETPKVHLFTLDSVDYYVPAYIEANVTLKYLRILREEGAASARTWMLENALGRDGYTALMEWDGLTDDILLRLVQIVIERTEGKSEATHRPLGRG